MKAIIIDDELRARTALRKMVEKYIPDLDIVADASSVTEGVAAIRLHSPDMLFLDVEMPQEDGFSLLENYVLPDMDIIFTTAHEEHAIRAMRLQAQDYLLKPIGVSDLEAAIARFHERHGKEQAKTPPHSTTPPSSGRKLMVPIVEGFQLIQVEDIVYCESTGSYTIFHSLSGKQVVSTQHLKTFELQFSEQAFHRIHHQYLVNLDQIVEVNVRNNHVVMSNGAKVSISLRKKAAFLQRLKRL